MEARDLARFMARVSPEPNSGCWLWAGVTSPAGYGQVARVASGRRRVRGAHRLSYEHFVGRIPDGLFVCHRCDVPACVNPDHLFLGTHADNMADMRRKERGLHHTRPERLQRGVRHWKAKLTPDDVRSIRAMGAEGLAAKAIARRYGVHDRTIRSILRGQAWAHVGDA